MDKTDKRGNWFAKGRPDNSAAVGTKTSAGVDDFNEFSFADLPRGKFLGAVVLRVVSELFQDKSVTAGALDGLIKLGIHIFFNRRTACLGYMVVRMWQFGSAVQSLKTLTAALESRR